MVETRRSKILGPDGEPIQVPLLAGETAEPQRQGARAVLYYNEASGLTPVRLAEIMRRADLGHTRELLTLAYDMEERYIHYGAQLQTRRLALDGLSVTVDAPKGADPKAVELLESLIADPMFPDLLAQLHDGVGKAYAVAEPRWEYQERALRPVEYQERDQRFFRYDEVSQRKLCLLEDNGMPGAEIRGPYFITHEPYTRAGVPNKRGLARPAAWAFVIQSFALQDWSAFCEIYGIPFRIGKYHPGATETEKATLLRAVRSIANDAAAIIPDGMSIDFQETSGNRGEAVFGNLIGHVDGKVSLLVLGQTLTSDVGKNGGALATAQVHENVRMDIVRFDGRSIASTINRDLARPFVAMNLGPQDVYPSIKIELTENEDLTALANFVDKVGGKLRIPAKHIRDRAGIPEPQEDEEVIVDAPGDPQAVDPTSGKKAPPAAPDKKGAYEVDKQTPDKKAARLAAEAAPCPHCGGLHARLSADDPTDPLDELLTGASDWEPQMTPLVQSILDAADASDDYDDFAKRLAALAPGMDAAALAKRLAEAQMKARALGDADGRS